MSAPATAPLPDLCPTCLAANIIAPRLGPTCPHHAATGNAWFPAWWGDLYDPASATRRLEHLKKLSS